jgi:hypothetical protein
MHIKIRRLSVIALALSALALAGCSREEAHAARRHHHRAQYSRIYQDTKGAYYTRSYGDDGDFWYWMYIAQSDSSSSSSRNQLGSGSWSQIQSFPPGLTATSRVVPDEEGKPTEEVEEVSAVPENEVVTETTTAQAEAEMQAADDAATGGPDMDTPSAAPSTESSTSEGSANDSGSMGSDSSGSDSGSSGGDSGGGGDGGGGGE